MKPGEAEELGPAGFVMWEVEEGWRGVLSVEEVVERVVVEVEVREVARRVG